MYSHQYYSVPHYCMPYNSVFLTSDDNKVSVTEFRAFFHTVSYASKNILT